MRPLAMTLATALLVLGGCGKPETRLAKHADEITEILESNMDSPKDGVTKVRDYLRSNLPAIAKRLATALVELDKIDNDAKRADRAKEMKAVLETPIKALISAAEKFAKRAEDDKATIELIKELGEDYQKLGEAAEEALAKEMAKSDGGVSARRAMTTEAIDELDKIYKSSATYYTTPMVASGTGEKIDCQFPSSQRMTPDVTDRRCCGGVNDKDGDNRCDVNVQQWSTETWSALNFQMNDQHYFGYAYESVGVLGNARFTASAYADLDCDGVLSTFQRYGYGDESASRAECSMKGSSAFYKNNETE